MTRGVTVLHSLYSFLSSIHFTHTFTRISRSLRTHFFPLLFTYLADYIERRDLTKGLGVEQTWTDYCTGLEAALLFNSYTYTGMPSANVAVC